MADRTVRIITLFGAAVMFALAIAMWMDALHSRAWAAVPFIHSAWMFWFSWRAHRGAKGGKASPGHPAAE